MKRKAVHLVSAAAEILRFLAVMFLADSMGAFRDPGSARALRYAAAPQLIFAAGFFFLWFDPALYAPYRPLLAAGKIVAAAALIPIVFAAGSGGLSSALFPRPKLALAFALFIAMVDICSLCVLAFVRAKGGASDSPGRDAPPASDDDRPGQGPGDIERVEG